MNLQAELSYLQAHLATLELPTPPPPPPPPTLHAVPPPLSIPDLPSAASMPSTYDLSSLFDPILQPSWTMMQQRQMDSRQFRHPAEVAAANSGVGGGGDLHALARELLHRHASQSLSGQGHGPGSDASNPPALPKRQ